MLVAEITSVTKFEPIYFRCVRGVRLSSLSLLMKVKLMCSFLAALVPKYLALLLIAIANFAEVRAEEKWPVQVQGFWQVTKSSLQVEDGVRDVSFERSLLVLDGTKLILVSTVDNGLPRAMFLETNCFPEVGKQKGNIRLPGVRFGIDGQEVQEDTSFPLEIEIHRRQEVLFINLKFCIENQRYWYEAIQLERQLGSQQLKGLLDSGLVCSPSLRRLLIQMIN